MAYSGDYAYSSWMPHSVHSDSDANSEENNAYYANPLMDLPPYTRDWNKAYSEQSESDPDDNPSMTRATSHENSCVDFSFGERFGVINNDYSFPNTIVMENKTTPRPYSRGGGSRERDGRGRGRGRPPRGRSAALIGNRPPGYPNRVERSDDVETEFLDNAYKPTRGSRGGRYYSRGGRINNLDEPQRYDRDSDVRSIPDSGARRQRGGRSRGNNTYRGRGSNNSDNTIGDTVNDDSDVMSIPDSGARRQQRGRGRGNNFYRGRGKKKKVPTATLR